MPTVRAGPRASRVESGVKIQCSESKHRPQRKAKLNYPAACLRLDGWDGPVRAARPGPAAMQARGSTRRGGEAGSPGDIVRAGPPEEGRRDETAGAAG